MNKEKINLLKMQLYLDYYKNDITDRYVGVINNIVFDNDVLNNLDERVYITTLDNYNKLQQRIDKLTEKINFYKTTEWGLRGCGILETFEEILKGSNND